jgi:hypothetical protein
MVTLGHSEVMTALALFIVFAVVCGLAAAFGADSRIDRPGRQL